MRSLPRAALWLQAMTSYAALGVGAKPQTARVRYCRATSFHDTCDRSKMGTLQLHWTMCCRTGVMPHFRGSCLLQVCSRLARARCTVPRRAPKCAANYGAYLGRPPCTTCLPGCVGIAACSCCCDAQPNGGGAAMHAKCAELACSKKGCGALIQQRRLPGTISSAAAAGGQATGVDIEQIAEHCSASSHL